MYRYELGDPGYRPEETALPAPMGDKPAEVPETMKLQTSEEGERDPGPAPACL